MINSRLGIRRGFHTGHRGRTSQSRLSNEHRTACVTASCPWSEIPVRLILEPRLLLSEVARLLGFSTTNVGENLEGGLRRGTGLRAGASLEQSEVNEAKRASPRRRA